jgi:predicted Zn-dependent protease
MIPVPRRRWLLALGLLAAVAACQTVPVTGRSALSLVPQSQMASMGAEAFADIRRKEPLSDNPQARERVTRVGRRIAQVAWGATGVRPEKWQFATFASDQKNAFALPGGHVGVYQGILQVARSDAELATVMGHEVAHVAANHGGERMSQALLANLGGMALSAAVSEKPAETRQLYMAAFGMGVQVGVMLPFSRSHELEADRIGLLYMARAGYDPRAAVSFWQRMDKLGKGRQPPEFLSTHPSHGKRIERLQAFMPRALKAYRQAGEAP